MSIRELFVRFWRWLSQCENLDRIWRSPQKRVLLVAAGAVIAVAAIGAAVLGGRNHQSGESTSARTISVERAVLRRMDIVLSVTGTLAARDEVAISAAVEGQRVAEVLVEAGDHVAAGQELVRLETDVLEAQRRDTEGRVARARALAAQQRVLLADAEQKFRRAEKLLAVGALSKQDYEDRSAALLGARHSLKGYEAELQQARAQYSEQKARFARAVIRAPADGIISERLAEVGALAGAEPLVKYVRAGEIELEAEVPEADLPRIRTGQAVRVSVMGMDREVDGRVRLVGPKVDRDTRLGSVWISLPPDPDLRPGVFSHGTVLVARHNALSVRDRTILYGNEDGGTFVFVVDENGRAVRRAVKTGARHDGFVEILSGLSRNELVASRASAFLRDGDRIVPVIVSEREQP